jgi:hypothetical protein
MNLCSCSDVPDTSDRLIIIVFKDSEAELQVTVRAQCLPQLNRFGVRIDPIFISIRTYMSQLTPLGLRLSIVRRVGVNHSNLDADEGCG